jgi:predicted RNase H-like HicB family nuclease
MTLFAVVYERADDGNWHARAADLPVFSMGATRQEAEQQVREGIALYVEAMMEEGHPAPTQMAHDAGMVSVQMPSAVTP